MEVTTYKLFRKNLKLYLSRVNSTQTPLVIADEEVVILSKSDYDSMEETFYLLKSPANAERLSKGLADYNKDMGKKSLIE